MRKNQQDQTKTSNETGLGKSALEPVFRHMPLYIVCFAFFLFLFLFFFCGFAFLVLHGLYNRKAKTNATVILTVKLQRVLLARTMA